jgi:DNA-binding transcriptional regulator PaaX
MAQKHAELKRKIILLLLAGVALGINRSSKRYFMILKELGREWRNADEKRILRAIRELHNTNLISYRDNKDGTTTVLLSKQGKKVALTYNFENIVLKKEKKWDKEWRVVLFDIPEKFKKARDALRFHLKRMEFYEYQKSVFVTPYNCLNEIEYLREFYHIKPYIRIITAKRLDNEVELKRHFGL